MSVGPRGIYEGLPVGVYGIAISEKEGRGDTGARADVGHFPVRAETFCFREEAQHFPRITGTVFNIIIHPVAETLGIVHGRKNRSKKPPKGGFFIMGRSPILRKMYLLY